MKYMRCEFIGVKTADWDAAQRACEALIKSPLKCTTSTFHGGRHCHCRLLDVDFDLRLNHHDDGAGWSWCINDPRYPLVLSCTFLTPAAHARFMTAIQGHPLIEVPTSV